MRAGGGSADQGNVRRNGNGRDRSRRQNLGDARKYFAAPRYRGRAKSHRRQSRDSQAGGSIGASTQQNPRRTRQRTSGRQRSSLVSGGGTLDLLPFAGPAQCGS